MKFRHIATALAFAPVAALAEGESGSTGSTGLSGVLNDVQSGLETMAGQVLTAVGAVVVACLVFWGLKAAVRWARSYFGK